MLLIVYIYCIKGFFSFTDGENVGGKLENA